MDLLPLPFYKFLVTLFVVFNILNSCYTHASTETPLAQFKAQAQTSQRMVISLYSNQAYLGEFNAYVSPEATIQTIDKKSFQLLMKKYLVKEKFDEFIQYFEKEELLTKQNISSFGLDILYDSTNFKLDLRAPGTFLNPSHISIKANTIDQNEVDLYPASFSAFVNYSFNEQFIKEKSEIPSQSKISGALDPVFNYYGIVGESHHVLDPDGRWIRTGSKVTKDIVKSDVRVSVGDQNYYSRSFQTPYQYFGLSVSTAFDISPLELRVTSGENEFYLETPSVVEISVNGFIIQTLSLEPGRHSLEDIPLSQGINHVAIKVTDSSGFVRIINFKQTGSENLLRKGLHEFSYDLGSVSKAGIDKIYYPNNPILSMFHRYGVNKYWTTGVSSQFNHRKMIVGAENQVGNSRGLYLHNLSISQAENKSRGLATKFSYAWTCPCGVGDQVKRLTLSYEYQTPKFLSNLVYSSFVLNNLRHTIQLSYNQKITDSISGIAQASVSTLDLKKSLSEQYSSGLNYRIKDNLFSNIYWTQNFTKRSANSTSVLVQLSLNFDGGKKNLIGTYNEGNDLKNYQVEYSHNSNKSVNNSIYRARVSADQVNKSTFLGSYFNTQYNEIAASFDYQKLNEKKEININPYGSISLIANKITLGQRINQSFVVVDNELRESVIINGDQDNHEAYLTSNSRALLIGVQPYVAKSVNVISDDNKSLGLSNKEYRVMANYKSGSYLKLGSILTRTIEGILVNELDVPLTLVGARLVNMSTGAEIQFFTGRSGVFYIDNIKADNYQIIVYDKQKILTLNLDLTNKLKDERNNLGRIKVQ